LPLSSLFMVGKAQKSHGARSGLYGGCSNEGSTDPLFPSRTENSIQISPRAISGLFQPWKGSSEARNFEVINGLHTETLSLCSSVSESNALLGKLLIYENLKRFNSCQQY
jgi:hypothetical protein